MMCDIIIAADNAKFGQPEIKLGVIPGIGGSQRLTRQVGKSKAMEMCLTGRMMDAEEAERAGLVVRVVPAADVLAEAMKTAETIASMSLPTVMLTKEAINRA
jgi:enoyl-CoA hydratase